MSENSKERKMQEKNQCSIITYSPSIAKFSSIQQAIDSVPENGMLKLEAGIFKGSFTVKSKITIEGSGFSETDAFLENLQTVIIVPDDEKVSVQSAAVVKGIIFVGEKFYEEHKEDFWAETAVFIPDGYMKCVDQERNKKANEIHEKLQKEFQQFSDTNGRDTLYDALDENPSESLLNIATDGSKLNRVLVIGSSNCGISVSGQAEISGVFAFKNRFSNLFIFKAGEVYFSSAVNKVNFFSYSYREYGVCGFGKIAVSEDVSIYAVGNMLEGFYLTSSVNVEKRFGHFSAYKNFGGGIYLCDEALMNVKSIYSEANGDDGICLNGKVKIQVGRISTYNNRGHGIILFQNSELFTGLITSCNNSGAGIGITENARLESKDEVFISGNDGRAGGLALQGNAIVKIFSLNATKHKCSVKIKNNAKLFIYGSKSKIYDDEDCLMDIDDSAKAELSNVRFFHEEEESGYITHADECSGHIFISANASVKLSGCYFYNFLYENPIIYVSDSSKLKCESCYFGFSPKKDTYYGQVKKIKSIIRAVGNSTVKIEDTRECFYANKYFITAEKSSKIETDAGEVRFINPKKNTTK